MRLSALATIASSCERVASRACGRPLALIALRGFPDIQHLRRLGGAERRDRGRIELQRRSWRGRVALLVSVVVLSPSGGHAADQQEPVRVLAPHPDGAVAHVDERSSVVIHDAPYLITSGT